MRVLVCGGRDLRPLEWSVVVEKALVQMRATEVIEGGSRGGDEAAWHAADRLGLPVQTFKADWASEGRAAGPRRNQRMLEEGKPDLVLALPGGRGTADMVRRAQRAGVRVVKLRDPARGAQ